jgi:polyvinyl alcohol dehydrogenase (cytochrome)
MAAALFVAAVMFPVVTGAARAGVTAPCAGTDWAMFGHDPARPFASPDTCISPTTVATLAPKWFFDTGSPVTAQPAVVGGTLYVGAFDGKFYALDAATGAERWSFDVSQYDQERTDYGKIDDSAAVVSLLGREMVVFGGGDTLFVLDATTGKLVSNVSSLCLDRLDPTCQGRSGIVSEIESSPAVIPWTNGDDLVLVGQDSNEANPSPVEGLVAVVLAPDGSLTPLWQFDPETLSPTTSGLAPLETTPTDHGCSDVWSSPTVDVTTGTVVFGIGNCNHPTGPTQDESTIAVDLTTGALKWQAEPIPYTAQEDLDFGATPNLLDGGLVGEGGKDGVYYGYPLASGPPATWQATVATPSGIGGIIGSTAVGQVHTTEGPHQAVFADTAIPVAQGNPQASITTDATNPTQAMGVHAIDAVTGKVLWNAPVGPSFGAAVYDHGVVFTPDTTNDSLIAFDADTGIPLRVVPLDAPPSSPVAISGDWVYEGAGTTESSPPLSELAGLGGIWGLQTAA